MSDVPSPIDFATITLDRERRLVLDMVALRRAEPLLRIALGRPTVTIWQLLSEVLKTSLEGSIGLTELSILMTEAFRRDDPAITEEAVLQLLAPRMIPVAVLAVAKAVSANFPDPVPSGGAAPARPLTGSTSGPPPAATSDSTTPSSGV